MVRIDPQADYVGIDAVVEAPAHDQADTLHNMIAAHVNRILVWGENARGDRCAVHLLDGDHIGVELRRGAAQQIDVLRFPGVRAGGQFAVTVLTGSEPIQIPGRQLEFSRNRETWQQQQENEGVNKLAVVAAHWIYSVGEQRAYGAIS